MLKMLKDLAQAIVTTFMLLVVLWATSWLAVACGVGY